MPRARRRGAVRAGRRGPAGAQGRGRVLRLRREGQAAGPLARAAAALARRRRPSLTEVQRRLGHDPGAGGGAGAGGGRADRHPRGRRRRDPRLGLHALVGRAVLLARHPRRGPGGGDSARGWRRGMGRGSSRRRFCGRWRRGAGASTARRAPPRPPEARPQRIGGLRSAFHAVNLWLSVLRRLDPWSRGRTGLPRRSMRRGQRSRCRTRCRIAGASASWRWPGRVGALAGGPSLAQALEPGVALRGRAAPPGLRSTSRRWQDHFDVVASDGILCDINDRTLHYWGADGVLSDLSDLGADERRDDQARARPRS